MRYIGLDLSTKTGRVDLSPSGEVLREEEIIRTLDTPEQMYRAVEEITVGIKLDDKVAIEGFSYSSKGNSIDKQFGIGWLLRVTLWIAQIPFVVVAPTAVKKFACNTGVADKRKVGIETYKRWGYENDSDNVVDAYILAQIVRAIHEPIERTKFQEEVIQTVTGAKKEKKARKKK